MFSPFSPTSPEHKLLKSEEDLPPLTRQRSNTLPKSFGSQLEKKPQQEKVPKPPVETTLETILKKLQEKREEVNRPEDIKVRPRAHSHGRVNKTWSSKWKCRVVPTASILKQAAAAVIRFIMALRYVSYHRMNSSHL